MWIFDIYSRILHIINKNLGKRNGDVFRTRIFFFFETLKNHGLTDQNKEASSIYYIGTFGKMFSTVYFFHIFGFRYKTIWVRDFICHLLCFLLHELQGINITFDTGMVKNKNIP